MLCGMGSFGVYCGLVGVAVGYRRVGTSLLFVALCPDGFRRCKLLVW